MDELADTERQVLDFERAWWKHPGAKDAAIRERFGWSPVRHYQVLHALLDRPEALAADPMTVRRLARVREAKRGQRAG